MIRRSIFVPFVPPSTVRSMTGLPRAPRGYFDAVSGLELAPVTQSALVRAGELAWVDPARAHHLGQQSALLVTTARSSLAASLSRLTGIPLTAEHVFLAPTMSSAATWALAGFHGVTHLARSAIESLVIADVCTASGLPVTVLPVDSLGHVEKSVLEQPSHTLLVIQAANAEIGTIQDISSIYDSGLPLLVDATHLLGRAPLAQGWSVLMADARSFGGPAGVTVLAANPSASWLAPTLTPLGWVGDGFNVPAVVAAATALESLLPHIADQHALAFGLVEHLRTRLAAQIPDVAFAGDPDIRLPHILNASVLYVSGEALVSELDRRGFAVASGSACVADSDRASHVLVALGAFTGGNLRISLPFDCSLEDVNALADAVTEVVRALRVEAGI